MTLHRNEIGKYWKLVQSLEPFSAFWSKFFYVLCFGSLHSTFSYETDSVAMNIELSEDAGSNTCKIWINSVNEHFDSQMVVMPSLFSNQK